MQNRHYTVNLLSTPVDTPAGREANWSAFVVTFEQSPPGGDISSSYVKNRSMLRKTSAILFVLLPNDLVLG